MNAVVIQGTASLSNPTVSGGNLSYCAGAITGGSVSNGYLSQNCSAFDFAGTNAYLSSFSSYFTSLATTGTPSCSYGTCTLVGVNGVNVFNLSSAALSSMSSLIISTPSMNSSLVVVNINGTVNSFSNFGTTLNGGITAPYIIYNLYETTTLTFSSITVMVHA